MSPYYADDWLTVYQGDCRAVMAEMEPESVHCVVTSPPYWGLRDYGTASWDGGDQGCDHSPPFGSSSSRLEGGKATQESAKLYRETCGKCGARRIDAQLGLEPTPEAYVANLVAVFQEVRRVLRSDGTVWLNLGDSYAGGGTSPQGLTGQMVSRSVTSSRAHRRRNGLTGGTRTVDVSLGGVAAPGLKPKDLVGIPWRVAFALQADGWYLRSDIIWSKPNPMPESVTDRPTKSHEYLFLLSKSPRYYFDSEAVAVAATTEAGVMWADRKAAGATAGNIGVSPTFQRGVHGDGSAGSNLTRQDGRRNIRSVWTIATQPYPGAHFATFPPKLVEPCIKAGTSERGVCPTCGAPWVRVMSERPYPAELANARKAHGGIGNNLGGQRHQDWLAENPKQTTGWAPSCDHVSPLPPQPATVLDPFAGSGTTGLVAQSLSRRAVLIDLSLDYLGQLMDRNRDIPLGLLAAGGPDEPRAVSAREEGS